MNKKILKLALIFAAMFLMFASPVSASAKNFAIIGDSYSTFAGFIPAENKYYYPWASSGVTSVNQMWWKMLIDNNGYTLKLNDSYGGSTIANGTSLPSFVTRVNKYFYSGSAFSNPDIIFVVGGTNDVWKALPIGSVKYSDWTASDLSNVLPAFCYVLDYLKTNNPQSQIINLTMPVCVGTNVGTGMAEACSHYGVTNIICSGISTTTYPDHPTSLGQQQIYQTIITALGISSETPTPPEEIPSDPSSPDTPHIHTWNGGIISTPSSCIMSGIRTYTCTTCGETKTETIPARGHTWNSGIISRHPTCITEGLLVYTCNSCGSTRSETIPVTANHNWNDGITVKQPTCTEDGLIVYTCNTCKATKTNVLSKTGHTFSAWYITKEPTDFGTGLQERTCSLCQYKETVKLPAKGHLMHTWDEGIITTAPSCIQEGIRTYTCSLCHYSVTEKIPATGIHTFSEWTTTKQATVSAYGIQTRTCSVCSQQETRKTSKLKPTIKLNVSGTLPLSVKQTFTAKATGLALGDRVKSWKSSKSTVATVVNGIIKGKKAGTTKITVTLASGKTSSFYVKVQASPVSTQKIALNVASKLSLKKGSAKKITVTRTPVTCMQKITFKSSNPKVVSISGTGVIKAIKKGKAVITVTSGNKKTTVTITVI